MCWCISNGPETHKKRGSALHETIADNFQVDSSAPTAKAFSFALSHTDTHALARFRALSVHRTSTYKLRSILHLGTSGGNWTAVEIVTRILYLIPSPNWRRWEQQQQIYSFCVYRCFDYHSNFCTESENLEDRLSTRHYCAAFSIYMEILFPSLRHTLLSAATTSVSATYLCASVDNNDIGVEFIVYYSNIHSFSSRLSLSISSLLINNNNNNNMHMWTANTEQCTCAHCRARCATCCRRLALLLFVFTLAPMCVRTRHSSIYAFKWCVWTGENENNIFSVWKKPRHIPGFFFGFHDHVLPQLCSHWIILNVFVSKQPMEYIISGGEGVYRLTYTRSSNTKEKIRIRIHSRGSLNCYTWEAHDAWFTKETNQRNKKKNWLRKMIALPELIGHFQFSIVHDSLRGTNAVDDFWVDPGSDKLYFESDWILSMILFSTICFRRSFLRLEPISELSSVRLQRPLKLYGLIPILFRVILGSVYLGWIVPFMSFCLFIYDAEIFQAINALPKKQKQINPELTKVISG